MNTTLSVVLIEVIFILSILLITLVFVGWRQKKSKNLEFEQLLNKIAGREEERKVLVSKYLTEHQHLDGQAALILSEDFIEAEKQFIYLFLEQQMKQMPLTGFYENLCGLLDKYLNLLPAVEIFDDEKPLSGTKGTDDKTDKISISEPEKESVDWDTAFAESGDEMGEVTRREYEAGKESE